MASFALVVLVACGQGDNTLVLEDVTRVPVMSDAAAQATREAPAGTPATGEQAAATSEQGAPAAASPAEGAPPAAAPQTVTVTSHDIYFDPKELTIPANTDVTVELPNEGVTAHDFSIDALGIAVALPPGETKSVVINAPPGDYEYYCNVPGHKEAGMVGTLHVVEGAAAPAAEGAVPAASPAAEQAAPAAAPAEQAAAPAAAVETVTVVSHDIYFDPKEFTIPANTDVTVELPNEGVTLHDFSIDALGISVSIQPGATESVVINAPPGDYEYYCNVPGHKEAGMVGTLHVA
jgi:uncharacterized cupredoxin-like copper-binding protein